MSITSDDLSRIRNRESLFAFLKEKLNWPLDPEDPYTYDEQQVAGRASAQAQVSRLIPFTGSDPYAIFLLEFNTRFRRTDLREILRGIRTKIREKAAYGGAALESLVFVCATENYKGLRFCHFEEREKRQPRLRSFGFEQESIEETRTLRDTNLPALAVATNLMGEIDWKGCGKSWLSAWDVESVTKLFFKDYKRVFEEVEEQITGVKAEKRLFVQRLFNRLMFIHFLSKKGWLETPSGRKDYLHALWADRRQQENFYRTYLTTLFFSGLNAPGGYDLTIGVGPLIGKVPFLNGGLFEPAANDQKDEVVPDSAVHEILALFARYRFTITESTPDDQEVAVDPEMLGKVFEELVTGRHESGSYYTPRPIVAFMCREALKGYLTPICGSEATAALVDRHEADTIADPEAVLKALHTVRVVDPACGSGAYLLGMLHELMALRQSLFAARKVDPKTDYKRKLEIIQNNLYGVDLDPFAIETARLRLWLSLTVDFDGDKPEPLPNLDFKIEQGDSLLGPCPESGAEVDAGKGKSVDVNRENLINEFETKKADFANPYWSGNKSELRKQIEKVRQEIFLWWGRSSKGFDWRVEFAEAFREGGFDIVLANPPYVRQELITESKPTLKTLYPTVYKGTADLYCYFYARSTELLRQGGMLAFISPNKWFKAAYGAPLRKHMTETCCIESITDFGELPVFETAATFPMIFVAQKGKPDTPNMPTFTQVKSLEDPYPDVLALIVESGFPLPTTALNGENWTLTNATIADKLQKMEKAGIPLVEYVKGKIYRGVLTGFNKAFVIDGAKRAELIAADPKSAEIIKPLAVGDDVRKWQINKKDTWIIFTRRGIDIDKYIAIKKHLLQWESELTPKTSDSNIGRKPGRYKWYEIQDDIAYFNEFSKHKIIYPEICSEPRFSYDRDQIYTNNKAFIIPLEDTFLLAILNSSHVWEYAKSICSSLGDENKGGRLMLQWTNFQRLPVPHATDSQKAVVSDLVEKILEKKKENPNADVSAWETEIDSQVAELYGL